VAAAPPDQTPAHDAAEVIDETWLSPKEALRLHREGQIDLIFPTIRNLQAIARFERSSDLLDAAAAAGHVPLIEPRVVVDGRAMRILLPGTPVTTRRWRRVRAPAVTSTRRSGSSRPRRTRATRKAERGGHATRPAARPRVGPTIAPGVPVELAPGVVRVSAPNPSMMTGPGTNTYLVGPDR